jgi:phosphate transport system substrate-binding protein
VAAFLEFYLSNVKALSAEVDYVPLSDEAYKLARQRFDKRQAGTSFGGKSEGGLRIEEVLKREPAS